MEHFASSILSNRSLRIDMMLLRWGASGNAWPHGHGKGEGARESMELLPCVLKVVVYPSYNDIHDIFLSEISSQRSRH